MLGRWLLACATIGGLVACGAGNSSSDKTETAAKGVTANNGDPNADLTPAQIATKLAERPWEVISNKGETYLPNVFYADAAENEQIMPYAIGGHVQIDRMVYPTIGNPNLYTKSDLQDEFVVVLRIEDAAMAHLNPQMTAVPGSNLKRLNVPNDPKTGFGFFLVARNGRDANTGSTTAISSGAGTPVSRIYPNDVLVNAEPDDEPAVF
jgi:hypothetical protein